MRDKTYEIKLVNECSDDAKRSIIALGNIADINEPYSMNIINAVQQLSEVMRNLRTAKILIEIDENKEEAK